MGIRRRLPARILSALMAAGIFASVCSAAAGDIDGNSLIGASDVKTIASHILGKKVLTSASQASLSDLSGDNKVNAADWTLLKRMLLQAGITVEKVNIHLRDNGSTVEGNNATVGKNGNVVTITASGEYYIDGSLSNGQIIVNVPDETIDAGTVKLFFDGITLACASDAPVYIINAENTSINLVAGTTSTISDGTVYTETEAAIFAKDDLTIKGEGELVVNASTYFGIDCNNDLKINGANVSVNTETEDAIRGKTSVTVKAGNVNVDAKGDGIKSTKGDLLIEGGIVSIKAGNDALQAETSLDITGGDVIACGDRGLTCATGKTTVTGGSLLATATDNQCESLASTDNALVLDYSVEWAKNNPVELLDGSGNTVFAVNTRKKFSYAVAYSESLKNGTVYSLYTGGIHMAHSASRDTSFKAGSAYTQVGNAADGETLYSTLFSQNKVHRIDVDMPDSQWRDFLANAEAEEYYSATVTIDGEKFENVGVRTKGYSSRMFVTQGGSEKYSLRIQLDKYNKLQNYKGLTEFCLNNCYSDPSCMRDILCYNALDEIGGYSPYSGYADMYLNGSLFSFYFLVELPDETYAERTRLNTDANLYKSSGYYCSMEPSQDLNEFSLKFGADETLSHVSELISVINSGSKDRIDSLIDVPSFLKGFAVNAVLCNYDSYNGSMAHNFFLLYDGGKFYYVGWDYNLALGNFMDYGASVNSDIKTGLYDITADKRPMLTKLLAIPEYYNLYTGYVKEILDYYSNPAQTVNSLASLIRNNVKADPRSFFTAEKFEENIAASPGGLVVGTGGGLGGGFDWGGMWGGGGFGGFGGGMWGGGGGLFSYGGDQVSILDFMNKRWEVIRSALGF